MVAASVKFLVLGAATTAARTHSSSETKGTGHGVAHDDGVDRASLDLALESVIAGLETEYAAVQVD